MYSKSSRVNRICSSVARASIRSGPNPKRINQVPQEAISAFCKITSAGSDSKVRKYFRGALVHRDKAFPSPPTAAVEAR